MHQSSPWKQLNITAHDSTLSRLDKWVAENEPEFSRRQAAALITSGHITVNGKKVAKNFVPNTGQTIEFWSRPEMANWTARPCADIVIKTAYEDEHLAIVEKPSGIPSVPKDPNESRTLAGGILARYPQCKNTGRQPGDTGLLQRLDFETSGLVIVAKTESAFNLLLQMQKNHKITKSYLALIANDDKNKIVIPPIIEQPLGSASKSSKTVKIVKTGTLVKTRLAPVEIFKDFILIKAAIKKGFRHQIRVHLAWANLPIAGDKLYKGPKINELDRLFLHASGLKFFHPVNQNLIEIESKLPLDLQTFINSLNM